MTQNNSYSLLEEAPLGKKSNYHNQHNAELLFPISREKSRKAIHIEGKLPFTGYDLWNAYEISWINKKGKPMVAMAEIVVPVESLFILESKSVKLYFNSLNNSKFEGWEEVEKLIKKDFEHFIRHPIEVRLLPLEHENLKFDSLKGFILDELDIDFNDKEQVNKTAYLAVSDEYTEEKLSSHLLKANCLVTGQPDWGSIEIHYKGLKIDRKGLLRYIISYREQQAISEQLIEKIYLDILAYCAPSELSIFGRFTRRGGIDINPYRTNGSLEKKPYQRLARQ